MRREDDGETMRSIRKERPLCIYVGSVLYVKAHIRRVGE